LPSYVFRVVCVDSRSSACVGPSLVTASPDVAFRRVSKGEREVEVAV
jgi:hypothetical protein